LNEKQNKGSLNEIKEGEFNLIHKEEWDQEEDHHVYYKQPLLINFFIKIQIV
jgi:hypothetical protein